MEENPFSRGRSGNRWNLQSGEAPPVFWIVLSLPRADDSVANVGDAPVLACIVYGLLQTGYEGRKQDDRAFW